LTKFGRIFSSKEIGKYSAKLKNIHDNIINSTGIVMIYSEYIDSGVIPAALMLEEMGFVRHKHPNLFKRSHTPTIDALTLTKTPSKHGFFPASYAIISGDDQLSPSNTLDMKALTCVRNDTDGNNNSQKCADNRDGRIIKVVIISRAGAEGLDYKNVRQIHIMDPWHNMSRIEQIIGRGVRNSSHVSLPFEQRNVQIFLHATILKNKSYEAADLYMYKSAEKKAHIMGHISRAIKESSVDCIINKGQQNFTATTFANDGEEQQLSNGKIIKDYIVGDKSYSSICDYMQDCKYECSSKIDSNKISSNTETYSEPFIASNTNKIIDKIKIVMKLRFFFTRNELIKHINIPKQYPVVQIYYALTSMIDNRTTIYDMYDRQGTLANIGNYYLFQPKELNNENISIFDRSVPIAIKPHTVQLNVHDLAPERKHKTVADEITYDDIYHQYEELMYYITNPDQIKTNKTEITELEMYAKVIHSTMGDNLPNITIDLLVKCAIYHIIDKLTSKAKLNLMNNNPSNKSTKFDDIVIEYLTNEIIHIADISEKETIKYTLIYNKISEKTEIYIVGSDNKWTLAEQETIIQLSPFIANEFELSVDKYNNNVGFINKDVNTFKIQNITNQRSSGATCDEMGKKKTLKMVNDTIGINKEHLVQPELCIYFEFVMRGFNYVNYTDKKWFVTFEHIMQNKTNK